ncbi:DUF5134 domain-containing protein [Streptomyces sp. NBC_01803]|uniref:DUF5134 domain-containing protein n=1 Tax=Streptomyces sp. NBC_01803 TaxID=2975946 RepID=UPI002DD923A2|nr:DUF5134 domain-containing protein [Streptomyces sp. NBC_01803]WSA42857.1 DUF5134 domain-containing protein [Streptomyces sp. NBC_01803]
MHGPELVGWLVVALCGGTGAFSLARMRAGPAGARHAAGIEAAMGFGMALMAVPPAALPATPPPAGFAVLFAATALWSAALLRAGAAHQAHHVVESLAMVYMAVAMAAAPGGHAGHAPGGVPLVTGVLLAYFALYTLRTGPRLLPTAAGGTPGPVPVRGPAAGSHCAAPELAAACRLALSVGMFATLLAL